jgi:pimeloyl-ACP methyl ester carboxylesterase
VKQTVDGLQKIKGLNIEGKTRKTAMDVIQQSFKDPGIANFVASNLVYDEASDRKFVKWCVNLDSIIQNIESIIGFDDTLRPFTGPTLFLNGSLSVKVEPEVYKKKFPECNIVNVDGAGHYVHTDKPKITVESIALFLESVEQKA